MAAFSLGTSGAGGSQIKGAATALAAAPPAVASAAGGTQSKAASAAAGGSAKGTPSKAATQQPTAANATPTKLPPGAVHGGVGGADVPSSPGFKSVTNTLFNSPAKARVMVGPGASGMPMSPGGAAKVVGISASASYGAGAANGGGAGAPGGAATPPAASGGAVTPAGGKGGSWVPPSPGKDVVPEVHIAVTNAFTNVLFAAASREASSYGGPDGGSPGCTTDGDSDVSPIRAVPAPGGAHILGSYPVDSAQLMSTVTSDMMSTSASDIRLVTDLHTFSAVAAAGGGGADVAGQRDTTSVGVGAGPSGTGGSFVGVVGDVMSYPIQSDIHDLSTATLASSAFGAYPVALSSYL